MVFACTLAQGDILYVVYRVPTIALSRAEQRADAAVALGLPPSAHRDVAALAEQLRCMPPLPRSGPAPSGTQHSRHSQHSLQPGVKRTRPPSSALAPTRMPPCTPGAAVDLAKAPRTLRHEPSLGLLPCESEEVHIRGQHAVRPAASPFATDIALPCSGNAVLSPELLHGLDVDAAAYPAQEHAAAYPAQDLTVEFDSEDLDILLESADLLSPFDEW